MIKKSNFDAEIPFPEYSSWMHPRIKVRNETPREQMARWKRQPARPLSLDVVLSHLIKWFKLYTSTRKWILYLTVFKFFYYFMKNL